MNNINKIIIDPKLLNPNLVNSLSPYLIPEYMITSNDPITDEIILTFRYINAENDSVQVVADDMKILYTKMTYKIVQIINFKPDKIKSAFKNINNLPLINAELIQNIISTHFASNKKKQ